MVKDKGFIDEVEEVTKVVVVVGDGVGEVVVTSVTLETFVCPLCAFREATAERSTMDKA